MHNIVFLGTSTFAVPSLESLVRDPRFNILGVITQPDRPVGRHAEMTPPPVKVTAEQLGLTVLQPDKLKELQADASFAGWSEAAPDAFVVVSYGKILPKWFLDIPRKGAVNVHGSLLPRWRGASPVHAAIAAGDHMTGVTIMCLDEQLDHGPILSSVEEPVSETDTTATLEPRLAEHGARILPDTLDAFLSGKITPREQDHDLATTCRTLTREDGRIDWTKSSEDIERLVRAYHPWPGTWTEIDGKRVKILAAQLGPSNQTGNPGDRITLENRPHIICGNGTTLELVRVQLEGKKPIRGGEWKR